MREEKQGMAYFHGLLWLSMAYSHGLVSHEISHAVRLTFLKTNVLLWVAREANHVIALTQTGRQACLGPVVLLCPKVIL